MPQKLLVTHPKMSPGNLIIVRSNCQIGIGQMASSYFYTSFLYPGLASNLKGGCRWLTGELDLFIKIKNIGGILR